MLKREEVFEYSKAKYNVDPDYPWEKFSDYAVLRHNNNEKWFALILDITADKIGLERDEIIDVLNLKVRSEFIDSLRQKDGFYPAYHMGKSN